MQSVDAKLAEILGQLEKAVQTYGPAAMQLLLRTVQITAQMHIVVGLVSVATALACLVMALRNIRYLPGLLYDKEAPVVFKIVVWSVTGAIAVCAAMVNLFDTNTWLAAFDPRLALARALLLKAGIGF